MANVSSRAWLYHFTHVPPIHDADRYGAFHAAEVLYVFDNLDHAYFDGIRESDEHVADVMSSYWVNFATTGDPNGDGLPVWTPFEEGDESYLEIAAEPMVGRGLLDKQIDFFDRFYAAQGAH
jgi:para-nitrobenzyl esterase